MSVISMNSIVCYYNSVIKQFMDDGYVISPVTTNGSYARVNGYTDLVNTRNKKSIIRVFVTNDCRSTDNYYYTIIKVVARKYEWDGRYFGRNLWSDCGELLSEKTFYQVKENQAYADNLDEFDRIRALRRQRRAVCTTNSTKKVVKLNRLSADFVDRIMERINKCHGFKRATASCIDEVYSYRGERGYYSSARFRGEVTFSFNNRSGRITLT